MAGGNEGSWSHILWSLGPAAIVLVSVALAILEFLGLGDDHRSAAVGRKPKVLCALLIACSAGSAPMLRALMTIEGEPKISANVFRVTGDMIHNFACVFVVVKTVSQRSCEGLSWHTASLYMAVFVCRYLDLITMWFIELPDGVSIWEFVSVYNSVLKLLYLTTSLVLLVAFCCFPGTYDVEGDRFCKLILVLPAMLVAAKVNYYNSVVEILWTFSIYLESVAMVPQLLLLRVFPCACCYDFLACRKAEPMRSQCVDSRAFCSGAGNGDGIAAAAISRPVDGKSAVMAGPCTRDGLLWFWVLCMAMYRACYLLNWVWRYHSQEDYYDPIVWVSGCIQTSLFGPFFYHYVSRFVKRKGGAANQARYQPVATAADDEDELLVQVVSEPTGKAGASDAMIADAFSSTKSKMDDSSPTDDEWVEAARRAS